MREKLEGERESQSRGKTSQMVSWCRGKSLIWASLVLEASVAGTWKRPTTTKKHPQLILDSLIKGWMLSLKVRREEKCPLWSFHPILCWGIYVEPLVKKYEQKRPSWEGRWGTAENPKEHTQLMRLVKSGSVSTQNHPCFLLGATDKRRTELRNIHLY